MSGKGGRGPVNVDNDCDIVCVCHLGAMYNLEP